MPPDATLRLIEKTADEKGTAGGNLTQGAENGSGSPSPGLEPLSACEKMKRATKHSAAPLIGKRESFQTCQRCSVLGKKRLGDPRLQLRVRRNRPSNLLIAEVWALVWYVCANAILVRIV